MSRLQTHPTNTFFQELLPESAERYWDHYGLPQYQFKRLYLVGEIWAESAWVFNQILTLARPDRNSKGNNIYVENLSCEHQLYHFTGMCTRWFKKAKSSLLAPGMPKQHSGPASPCSSFQGLSGADGFTPVSLPSQLHPSALLWAPGVGTFFSSSAVTDKQLVQ